MTVNNTNKETILYIGGFEMPDKNAAAHRVLANAKIFRQLGYETVFVGFDKQLDRGTDVLETRNAWQGFTAYVLPYPKGAREWAAQIVKTDRYIKVAAGISNLKAVVCYDFYSVAMAGIRGYCVRNGIKCFADVTEWYSARGMGLVSGTAKRLDTAYRMRAVHKRLDGLIVISRYLENYYRRCKNVVRIPALTDTTEEKWQNEAEKSTDILKLVCTGSDGKDHIDLLIEALRSVRRPYHLDVIGIGKDDYLAKYPAQGELLSENKSIVFRGRLPHQETLEYVKAANYSCFFRDRTRPNMAGFPTKLAEAITAGTPVLTNVTSDIGDYVRDGKNGLMVPEITPERIAEYLNAAPVTLPVERETFDYRNYVDEMRGLFA